MNIIVRSYHMKLSHVDRVWRLIFLFLRARRDVEEPPEGELCKTDIVLDFALIFVFTVFVVLVLDVVKVREPKVTLDAGLERRLLMAYVFVEVETAEELVILYFLRTTLAAKSDVGTRDEATDQVLRLRADFATVTEWRYVQVFLEVDNLREVDDVDVTFRAYYAALCSPLTHLLLRLPSLHPRLLWTLFSRTLDEKGWPADHHLVEYDAY